MMLWFTKKHISSRDICRGEHQNRREISIRTHFCLQYRPTHAECVGKRLFMISSSFSFFLPCRLVVLSFSFWLLVSLEIGVFGNCWKKRSTFLNSLKCSAFLQFWSSHPWESLEIGRIWHFHKKFFVVQSRLVFSVSLCLLWKLKLG